jgi:hypothetical protein
MNFSLGVPFPPIFEELIAQFDVINLDFVRIFIFMSPCDFSADFLGATYAHMSVMPFFTFILGSVYAVCVVYKKIYPRAQYTAQSARDSAAQFFNFVVFLMYPGLTTRCFTVLSCFELNGKNYLRADISVSCDTDEYMAIRWIAVNYAIGLVLGVPLFYYLVLYVQRHVLVNPKHMSEMERLHMESNRLHHRAKRVYGSLFLQYERQYWWYECTELIRKAMMTGMLAAIPAGITRTAFAVLTCVLFMVISMNTRPYHSLVDDMLQQSLLLVLFFNFFSSLLLSAGGVNREDEWLGRALVTINVIVLVVGILILISLVPCCRVRFLFPCQRRINRFIKDHAREVRADLGGETEAGKYEMYYDAAKEAHYWVNIETGEIHWTDPAEGIGSLLMRATAKRLEKATNRSVNSTKVHPMDSTLKAIDENELKKYVTSMKKEAEESGGSIVAVQCVLRQKTFVKYKPYYGHLGVVVEKFHDDKGDDVADSRSNLLRRRGVRLGMQLVSVNGRDCRELSCAEIFEMLQAIRSAPDAKYHESFLVFAKPSTAASVQTLECSGKYKKGGKDVVTVKVKPGMSLFVSLGKIPGRMGAKISAFRPEKYGGSPAQKQGAQVGMHLVSIDGLDARNLSCDHILKVLAEKKEQNFSLSVVFAKHMSADKSFKGLANRIRSLQRFRSSGVVSVAREAKMEQDGTALTAGKAMFPDAPLDEWEVNRTPDGKNYWMNDVTGDVMWVDPNGPPADIDDQRTRNGDGVEAAAAASMPDEPAEWL